MYMYSYVYIYIYMYICIYIYTYIYIYTHKNNIVLGWWSLEVLDTSLSCFGSKSRPWNL